MVKAVSIETDCSEILFKEYVDEFVSEFESGALITCKGQVTASRSMRAHDVEPKKSFSY